MPVGTQERIGKALAFTRDGLRPFIEREGTAFYGQSWSSEVQRILGATRLTGSTSDPTKDLAAQLVLIDRLWGTVFRRTLGRFERCLVNELLEVRNRWAHQNTFSDEDANRALDSAARLLTAVSAPEASDVRQLIGGLKKLSGVDLTPSEGRAITAAHELRNFSAKVDQSGHRNRILKFLAVFPGKDDDEIAKALDIRPRQTVNQICRNLCEQKVLRRQRGVRGKIVNFIIANEGATKRKSDAPHS